MTHPQRRASSSGFVLIGAAMAATAPAIALRVGELTGSIQLEAPVLAAVIYGIAIMGAAFILSWAAEAAQKDVSAALALAGLAFIALLPEYSVEAYLAWDAGANLDDPAAVGLLAANVTGANRLLIGLGWSSVAIVFWLRVRRSLVITSGLTRELAFLFLATLLTFLIFPFSGVPVILGVILILVYLGYLFLSSRAGVEEPHLAGPAATLGDLPRPKRRTAVALLFLFSAFAIIVSVEPFVHSLIQTGQRLGIDEFHLIQWVAPLASESPEMVVALLYTARANPIAGITVLLSAEVNQLTVLIGTMPIIYSLSAGQVLSIVLEYRQATEFLLMSSLSLAALIFIARRQMPVKAALLLLGLFIVQLVFASTTGRITLSLFFLGATAWMVIRDPWRPRLFVRYLMRELHSLKTRQPVPPAPR